MVPHVSVTFTRNVRHRVSAQQAVEQITDSNYMDCAKSYFLHPLFTHFTGALSMCGTL